MKESVVAVIGASSNREKWGYKIYKKLKKSGFEVYAVNFNYDMIDEDKCYNDLKSLPVVPEMVITVIPPNETIKIVRECKNLGIKKVWMQPGSESEDAIIFCKENDMDVVHNFCIVLNGIDK